MHGQYLEQQTLTRPAGFYARELSDIVPVALPLLCLQRGEGVDAEGSSPDIEFLPRCTQTCTGSRQNPDEVFGIWVTRRVSSGMKERVYHVQCSCDPLTNLSIAWLLARRWLRPDFPTSRNNSFGFRRTTSHSSSLLSRKISLDREYRGEI